MIIVFFLLIQLSSAIVITLENITFPILIKCNQDSCEIDEVNETLLQNVNPNEILFTGICQDNDDCPRLQVCESTSCVAPSLGCTSDSQCFDGDLCLHGICSNIVTCQSNTDCTGETICLNDLCLPPPSEEATSTSESSTSTTSSTTSTSTIITTEPTTTTSTSTTLEPTTTTTEPSSTSTTPPTPATPCQEPIETQKGYY